MEEFTSFFNRIKIFIAAFLIFSFSISISEVSADPLEYTYKTVLIDGVWWVFVYQGDIVINSYPDDEVD
jgi:hypothetical protein